MFHSFVLMSMSPSAEVKKALICVMAVYILYDSKGLSKFNFRNKLRSVCCTTTTF
jgi:hypothetical protein